MFGEAIERCRTLFADASAAPGGGLLLINKRDAWMHNSWFANLERLKRGGRTNNPLGIHPDDAAALGVSDDDMVVVASEHGQIDAVIELDDDLMRGVVSMVHGWG